MLKFLYNSEACRQCSCWLKRTKYNFLVPSRGIFSTFSSTFPSLLFSNRKSVESWYSQIGFGFNGSQTVFCTESLYIIHLLKIHQVKILPIELYHKRRFLGISLTYKSNCLSNVKVKGNRRHRNHVITWP